MEDATKLAVERQLKELASARRRQKKQLKKIARKLEQLRQMCDAQVIMPSPFAQALCKMFPESTQKALKQRQLSRDILYLQRSPLFDPLWYFAEYPDIFEADIDAATHYVLHGEEEERRPSPNFKADPKRVAKYRELPLTGCYFAQYLRALEKQPGFLVTTDIKKTPPGEAPAPTHDLSNLFEGHQPKLHTGPDKIEVLFIGHDASLTGAPIALFELVQQLTQKHPINARIALQKDGPLTERYKKLCPVVILPQLTERTGSLVKSAKLVSDYFATLAGPKLALASTADVEAAFCKHLGERKIPFFTWVHEMPNCIERYFGGQKKLQYLSQNSTAMIFVSELNREQNISRFGLRRDNAKLIRNGVRVLTGDLSRAEARKQIRTDLGLPPETHLVMGCGTIEYRKGADLFVQAAKLYLESAPADSPPAHFIWTGKYPSQMYYDDLHNDIKNAGLEGKVAFIGERKNLHPYFEASDAFLFTSRSESFGLAAAEAISHGIPVIGFEQASGAGESIVKGYGSLTPYLDVRAMAEELRAFLLKKKTIKDDGAKFVAEEYSVPLLAENFYLEFRRVIDKEKPASNKTVLVVSGGCPPLCGHRAEGGGLRTWGLARSIKRLLPDYEVTLGYTYKLEDKIESGYYDGVYVTEWKPETLRELVGQFSTVVMSYCMGGYSKSVAEWLEPTQQLVLDCYVPIYIEVCARKSDSVQREYDNLMADIPYFNETLKRGDYFLCANTAQEDFYRGVLSALGRVNPKTYGDLGLRVVPYGIEADEPVARERPIQQLLGSAYPQSRKVLWFGAVYPWFNIKILIDAIALVNQKHPTQLIMVGAKNPFNGHPDFVAKAREVESLIAQPEVKDIIHAHDWVPFEDRANWYLDCDLIITLNEPGMENGLSWRTRVADYVWARMPVASNGGDPLTEELITHGAASRLDISTAQSLSESIDRVLADEAGLKKMKAQMHAYRPNLYWDNVTKPLADAIRHHGLAADRT